MRTMRRFIMVFLKARRYGFGFVDAILAARSNTP